MTAPVTADGARVLADFTLASEPGNERLAMRGLEQAVAGMAIDAARLDRLKTAVAEATMNAIEHGNGNQPEVEVHVQILASPDRLTVRITDEGAGDLRDTVEIPDIEAKLEGLQTPRGWGLFLIRSMVDELHDDLVDGRHIVELVLRIEPAADGGSRTQGGADDGNDTV